jgi:hypothetical protein
MVRSVVLVLLTVMLGLAGGCGGSSTAGNGGQASDAGGPPAKGHDAGAGGGSPAQDAGRSFDAGSDPKRNQVEPGMICTRLAALECEAEAYCCKMPSSDVAACRDAVQQMCATALMLDEIAADPIVAFDSGAASAAFAELEHRASVCDPSVAAWALSQEGFAHSFVGTRSKADDCEPNGGLKAAGAALGAALASCRPGDGLACLPGDNGWSCAEPARPGGRCYTDLNCGGGLYCENPMATVHGVCAERKAAGATCAAAGQCSSLMCKAGRCAASDDVQAAYCLQ